MKLAIDFDGVLHDPFNVQKGYKMGKPIPGSVDAIKYLKRQGHEITIFPTWADNQQRRKALVDWLNYFEIPFDDITSVKPEADFYIDNNAIRFDAWAQTITDLQRLSGAK